MKRAILQILFGLLIGGLTVAANCGPSHLQSTPPQSNSTVEPITKKNNTINYEGISFTFDPSLAPEVKSETIPAVTEGKPCDIVPEHPAFTLVGYPRPSGMRDNDPHIRAFRITAFRQAMSIASKEYAKSVIYPSNPPDWTTYFDEEVRVLKALLAKRPNRKI